MLKKLLLVALLILPVMLVGAQDGDGVPVPPTVTDDEVNEVASKLYCPVCENIPLEDCGTTACQDWRYEIELQLESGMTEQEIIDDFVVRFGDRVVGTPQDPILRAMSLVTPVVAIILGFIAVVWMLKNWREEEPLTETAQPAPDDQYRALLENDIRG